MVKFVMYEKPTENAVFGEDTTIASFTVDKAHYWLVGQKGKNLTDCLLWKYGSEKEISVNICDLSAVDIHIAMQLFHDKVEAGLL